MRTRLLLMLALATASVPAVVYAAPPRNFCELVSFFVTVFNALTGLFVLAALATYLYGISMNIKSAGEARSSLKTILLWGLIGLFVMVSVWGLLRILQETLFDAPPGGTVQSGRTC